MTFDKWQAPDRDSPQVLSTISFNAELGRQLRTLLQMEGRPGTRDDEVVRATGEALPRARRWHKFFERMGLLYQSADGNTALTGLGRELAAVEASENKQFRRRLGSLAIGVLRKYQLKNPSDEESDTYPEDCDLHPYWAIWRAAVALDGRLHWDELNRELMRVLRHADLDDAIQRIRAARLEPGYDPERGGAGTQRLRDRAYQQPGGTPRESNDQTRDQITTPWFKRATLGGFLMESPGAGGQGFWTIPSDLADLMAEEVRTAPPFLRASTTQEWFRYYGALPGPQDRSEPGSHVFGSATETKIQEIIKACQLQGDRSIIVLSGVPGTGKTLLSRVAAERLAGDADRVKEIQFHPAYAYEDFIVGMRPNNTGGFEPKLGAFATWNTHARADPEHVYVLLIEEFSRANLNAVLGELFTYIEHRHRSFELTMAADGETRLQVAPNLIVIATMNPRDRSALEVDDAMVRRLWFVDCPPDTGQLREMLNQSLVGGGDGPGERDVIEKLVAVFEKCQIEHMLDYTKLMPFGHGMFAGIREESDLTRLWHGRIRHLLRPPLRAAHAFTDTIERHYPWKDAWAESRAAPIAAEVPARSDASESRVQGA